MAAKEIILWDLDCKGRSSCFSGNVWKTRLDMNYKGLPYRTEWVTHDQIAEKLKDLVPEPNATGTAYTVPTIQLPDGTAVMESGAITQKLESLYPEPSLHLDSGLEAKLGPLLGKTVPSLIPVFMPQIGRDKILDSSSDYFQKTRAERFGMPLDELERTKGGETAWKNAEPGLREISALLVENKKDDGPFMLGSQPSHADFVLVALIEAFKRIGEDVYEKLVGYDENFRKLHQACEKWLTKDD